MKKLTIQEMGRMTPDEFRLADKLPLTVVLDNVRSRHNIGAVFRTADAFRLEKIWLCGCCSTPPNPEIHKTALGAEDTVAWQYTQDTVSAVQSLKADGYRIFAVEQTEGSLSLSTLKAEDLRLTNNRLAIVFGHEVFGVQQEIVDLCDGAIEIPQYGTKHSLNVSVAAGIVIYCLSELLRTNK